MKPFLAVLRYVYIFTTKILNHVATVKVSQTVFTDLSNTDPLKLMLALLSCSVTAFGQAYGTADFQIRTPKEIALAADSRQVDSQGNAIDDTQCKIVRFGRGVAIRAGFAFDRQTNFGVLDVLEKVSDPQLTLARQVTILERAIKEPLEKVLRRLKANPDQREYKHFIAKPVDITVVGLEKGRLLFFYRRFSIDDRTGTVQPFRGDCTTTKNCKNGTVVVYSNHPKTDEYLRQLKTEFPRYENSDNLEVIARRYVEIAIKDKAFGVGGEIDSVRITLAKGIVKTIKAECEKYWQ